MTTSSPPIPRRRRVKQSGGGLPGATAAEWTKLWSLDSTWILLLTAAATMGVGAMGIGLLTHVGSRADAAARVPDPATSATIHGVAFVVAALAMLSVTGEYATGSITNTLQCVPDRTRMMLAKCIVMGGVAFVAGLVLGALGIVAGALAFETTEFDRPQALAQIAALAVLLTLMSLVALGLAAMVRNSAGTLAALFLLLIVVPAILAAIPFDPAHDLAYLLPQAAGACFAAGAPAPYSRPTGLLLLTAWSLAAPIAATVWLRHRDA
ncbi:ABC transporter permease (plasmid) [Embleya sp. NBC_00888]|uniref:ABC transporter permease n=1 Tax=Embleya sp. NBC_00888 TaxID=2975960 RepID=UPI002F90FB16|nr:ABC transporter permease [Embleya sp. NBC_00888]